jgi:hypothetical protein
MKFNSASKQLFFINNPDKFTGNLFGLFNNIQLTKFHNMENIKTRNNILKN